MIFVTFNQGGIMATGHGGKRDNAGRKKLTDVEKKQTVVIRVDVNLLPLINQLKQGVNPVTENQDELGRWQQRNIELVIERDSAMYSVNQLNTEINHLKQLKVENNALKTLPGKQKTPTCQCLTAKGVQCSKTASHENIVNGFVVFTCERHYQTKINRQTKGKND
jgi:hypothetical protein